MTDVADAKILCREGLDHFANDRIDEAIACYRRAVEADAKFAIGWNGLSTTLRRKGDLDGAIEAAREIINLEPDDPLGHTNLSILYQTKGMIQEAEDEKALALQMQMKAQRESQA